MNGKMNMSISQIFQKDGKALELYLKMQQESILKTAKEVNIMKAFMQN